MDTLGQRLLVLEPQYRERVWGGRRLRRSDPPIGEAWIAYGLSVVEGGPHAGKTLDALMASHGPALIGAAIAKRYPARFPILIKLLDCADWLSVQVHPNDEQARRLVGPDEFGKTEAWYFLEAEPGAAILAGVKPDVDRATLAAAIREGRVLDVAEHVEIRSGDSLLIPAGTLHALGPGLFLYEIQQASDTTYRAYDWGRPQSTGRRLHIEESVEVTEPVGPADRMHPEVTAGTGAASAMDCPLFDVDLVRVSRSMPWSSDTLGRSFHVITVTEGTAELACGEERVRLGKLQTALVAGWAGAYEVCAVDERVSLLRATVPA
jgi:mannose-6-phosphate isomerase